ncbi:MAG TPA: hypothetical protein ENI34_03480 [candidate division WOR-3 bacterium]|uniref:Fibronectin type-III domain-containing protein n=1 Tax=candidate division WOR-3 bacterium TaxID=2052148 RepID=A0A9C9EM73_UNCW3|nr:hypothetical protein [candidate division WOR-3 bacterium]
MKVKAYDVRNNADSESVLVHIDNFAPRVKQTYPSDWFAFVSNKQHKIWCCFSEPMDTTTLTAENIKIQSLKADSFNYPIINISYIQVDSIPLYKLLLEVDSFRFKDTVQVRLSDSIRDLAGKSIDTTDSKQTIAYSWTFFVGVIQLTDNDLNDIQPDVYHNKIVWTQAPADSYLGEIMLYDFYNNTTDTISPGGGEHNYPVIWQNKVVWRRYPDDYTNPIYYYDGTSVTIVASGNRGRNIYDIDSSGIALRSYYGNGYPDTTWIEYYHFATSNLADLDTFTEELGRYYGGVDIDGYQIVWDHTFDYYGTENDVYLYDGVTIQNITNEPDSSHRLPVISDGQVAWIKHANDGRPSCVWLYDGLASRQISEGHSCYTPEIDNGQVIWYAADGSNHCYLHYYTGRKDTILDDGYGPWWAYPYYIIWGIHNGQAVWARYRKDAGGWTTIDNATYYDGKEIKNLVDNDASHTGRIEVHDGFVVYDAWDGNDYEIYLYIGDTLFTPPAVVRNLHCEIITASAKKVKLIWSPNSEPDLAGYHIYRSNIAYQYDTIPYATVSAQETTFVDTIPLLGMNYYVATAFDNSNNEGGFSNQVEVYIDTVAPAAPTNLVAGYDSLNQTVSLIWNSSADSDLKLYRIYRAEVSGGYGLPLDSVLAADTTYIDSSIFLNKIYYYVVSAVDTNQNESSYSNEDSVETVPITSGFARATAYNNASRIIRNPLTGEILLAYNSNDSTILCISSSDGGITWNRSEPIGTGTFPTLVLDSENSPCCLFGRWVGPTGYGSAQLYYTKYLNDHWTTPYLLVSIDSVYIGIPEYAIPAPSAGIDFQDTIHITWMSAMGQEYPHRFAVWYGNLYALDTIPAFNYVQLDTIWVYESSPCPTLAIDGSQNIHIVYETDPAAPTLFYRFREDGIWREKEIIESEGCYYPDLEFFGDRIHLVWDYRYPDTTVAHKLHYRSRSSTGWDTIMMVYEPLPFNLFAEPVNAGGWYTIWADQDIYYSRFNGAFWEEPETVRITPENSAHPTALFRQDLDDTCLYIAWTECDSAPYSIQFKKITVPSVPEQYDNLGQEEKSQYCIQRRGYIRFGDLAYQSVDWHPFWLRYRFDDLNPKNRYRLDLSYYFELTDAIARPPIQECKKAKSDTTFDP